MLSTYNGILGAGGASLAFNSSNYLSMSNADFGSYTRTKFAIACVYKPLSFSGDQGLMAKQTTTTGAGDREWALYQLSTGKIRFITVTGASVAGQLDSTATFTTQDWLLVLVHYDSGNATAGDRMRMWAGYNNSTISEITAFDTDTNPSAAVDTTTQAAIVGASDDGGARTEPKYLYYAAFFDNTLPALSSFYNSSSKKLLPISSILGVSGLKSLVSARNGITGDSVLGAAWTNNSSVSIVGQQPG